MGTDDPQLNLFCLLPASYSLVVQVVIRVRRASEVWSDIIGDFDSYTVLVFFEKIKSP